MKLGLGLGLSKMHFLGGEIIPLPTYIMDLSTTLIKDGNDLYIRTKGWKTNEDLVEQIEFDSTANPNAQVSFEKISTIDNTVLDADVPTATKTTIKTSNDDVCPIKVEGSYLSANHGYIFNHKVTMVAHGKTLADVGSRWVDEGGYDFIITKIVDADKLWMISENQSTSGRWSFRFAIVGNTFTHVLGATHTADIVKTASGFDQLMPAIKSQTKSILLNGVTPVTIDGVYDCDYLEILNDYNVTDVPSMIDYLEANIGSGDLDNPTIDTIVERSITYQFKAGACVVIEETTNRKEMKIDYYGVVQAQVVNKPSGGSIKDYVPRTEIVNVSGTDYDLTNIADVTALPSTLKLTRADWSDANNPPDRYLQFVENTSGDKVNGFITGYAPGIGNYADRKNICDDVFFTNQTGKMYAHSVSSDSIDHPDDIIPIDTTYNFTAFRCPLNYDANDVTNVSWYYVGSDIYLMMDFHSAFNNIISVPQDANGRTITVVDKTASVTINDTVVSDNTISVKVASSYGYAILKLT